MVVVMHARAATHQHMLSSWRLLTNTVLLSPDTARLFVLHARKGTH